MKPGSVSSAERAPPPIVGSASNSVVWKPASARTIAAVSPFGPDPMTHALELAGIHPLEGRSGSLFQSSGVRHRSDIHWKFCETKAAAANPTTLTVDRDKLAAEYRAAVAEYSRAVAAMDGLRDHE